jgi:hypothetical protein
MPKGSRYGALLQRCWGSSARARSIARIVSLPFPCTQNFDECDLIFAASILRGSVPIVLKNDGGGSVMNANFPAFDAPRKKIEPVAEASRLTDEKISDESGAESQTQSALAPAGLKNPFWN